MSSIRQTLLPLVHPEEIKANLTGNILNIHRLTANSPDLLTASADFRNYLVKKSALTDRQRELLILRLGHRLNSDYEWAHHVVRGRAAGLSDAEIEQVQQPPITGHWTADEQATLTLVDEMVDNQILSIETATAALNTLGQAGLIDAIFTIGYYISLGTLLKTFDVPLEDNISTL